MQIDEKQIAKELTIAILQKLNFNLYDEKDEQLFGSNLLQSTGDEVAKLYSLMCKSVVNGEKDN